MQWIAPSEKDAGTETLENRLWSAADQLRANSGLTSAQYSQPVLGLIFLRFAEARLNASIIRNSSKKFASTGGHVGCTMNTSAPRTFSSILTSH